MGTDIHLYVERQAEDGSWSRVRPLPWTCPWCDGTGKGHHGDCYNCKGAGKTTGGYHERNYNLFAMLADVRNGTGFAGVDTGDGFVPLADPRGLPTDTSIRDTDTSDVDEEGAYELTEREDYVWLGDHSFSYCTLAEAFSYDYDRTTKHRGVVNAAEYGAWVEAGGKGAPKEYSGGVMGNGVKMVSRGEMERMIVGHRLDQYGRDDGQTYYTTLEWEETYRKSAGAAWFAFLEACRTLGDPNKIRFVFGFDS
jgi:hypothetical protein